MRQLLPTYSFNVSTRQITLTEFKTVRLDRLRLITDVKTNKILYNFADPTIATATVSGNVITLSALQGGELNSDLLEIDYEPMQIDPNYEPATLITGARKKFRDGFTASGGVAVDPSIWALTNADSHLITQGGNSSGSSYLRISLNPLLDDTEILLTSKDIFRFPFRTGFGVSTSQRILGQEVFVGIVADDGSGGVDTSLSTIIADQALGATAITITTNVATVTMNGHPFTGGDRVSIYGCADSRLNVGPVLLTIIDANSFTVPITATNGTYSTTGGFVRADDPLRWASNGAGYLFENTTVTNASEVLRRNGQRFRSVNTSTSSTTAVQSNTNSYTDAFNSAANFESYHSLEEAIFRSYSSDSNGGVNYAKFTQGIPDEDPFYHLHIRARTLKATSKPVGRITAIAKTGTTTATVTTDVAHGLTTADWVQIYGVRDQANFPNLAAATAVASVVDSTHFTIVIGTATTTSSAGGAVWRNQGGVLAPGVYSQVVQSISSTVTGVMDIVGNATWATPLPGEYIYLHGMDGNSTKDGAYKVLKVNTTTLSVAYSGATFGSVNCGGAAIRMTDVRLHFARVMDYTRVVSEIIGGRSSTDQNNSVPVILANSATVLQSSGSTTSIWNAAGYGGILAIDIASAAITTTTTSAAVTPGQIANIGTLAHEFNVIVTAVSGTTPTLDVVVQESPDNGTNWFDVYHFPRITATGAYVSPLIPAKAGTRYRYVRTLTGTTPSFTMALNRVMFSEPAPFYRQFFDRSVVLTTLSNTTPTFNSDGAREYVLGIKVGAITTTAPVMKLQGNQDGTATGWFDLADSAGNPITILAVANAYVQKAVVDVPGVSSIRAIVSTAGVGVTADYVLLKALGY